MKNRWSAPGLIGAAAVAALGLSLWFQFGNLDHYGGPYLWPALLANFAASLGAFVLALTWDRRERAAELVDERKELARRREVDAKEEQQRRMTEARRLMGVVVNELEHDREAVRKLAGASVEGAPLAFHIRTGAWAMSADNLSRLLSKSDMVARISGLYDQLRELQWRLRFIAEGNRVASQLQRRGELEEAVTTTDQLVRDIDREFDALLETFRSEAVNPSVEPVGIVVELAGGAHLGLGLSLRAEGTVSPGTGVQTGVQESDPHS